MSDDMVEIRRADAEKLQRLIEALSLVKPRASGRRCIADGVGIPTIELTLDLEVVQEAGTPEMLLALDWALMGGS